MKFSMLQAAREAGVSQSTMHRKIQTGRISATRLDDGSYEIDPAELYRVYPPGWRDKKKTAVAAPAPDAAEPVEPGSGTPAETLALQVELRLVREMLDRSDRTMAEATATIADLRARLDREGEERRALNLRLLAHQPRSEASPPADPPAAPPPVSPAGPGRRRLFGFWRKAA